MQISVLNKKSKKMRLSNECISKESKQNQEKKQNGNKEYNSEYSWKDGKLVHCIWKDGKLVPKQDKKSNQEKKQNQQKKSISKKQTIHWDQQKKLKKYEGEMKDGKRNGKGILYSPNGKKEYHGEWKDDKRNGRGIEYLENGNKFYDGMWKNDKREGKGISYKLSLFENKAYDGEWKNAMKNGKGISYLPNGEKSYEGEWKDNYRNGKGVEYFYNGNKRYNGEWKDGKWNGKGISYNEDGKMLFKGYFKNGKPYCPPNKVFVDNNCVTKKKCGKKYIYDQNKNECNKKRIVLKNNMLGNVKWFKPLSPPHPYNLNVQLTQMNLKSFGSEIFDNTWITKQHEYFKKLNDIDRLFLIVYTDYGDVLINTYLLKGVKGISISAIFKKDFDLTINPFFPIFVKHPEIYKNNNSSESQESKDLCKSVLDKKKKIQERYYVFQKLFYKYFTKEFLEKTLEQYMNVFNTNLNRIIDKSPKLKKEMLVARGSKTELSYNDDWTTRFTSTSIKSVVAQRFSNGNYIDIYILKPGTPCIPLFASKYYNESEIILGSGCCKYELIEKKIMKEVQELAQEQFLYYNKKYIKIRYYEVSKKGVRNQNG